MHKVGKTKQNSNSKPNERQNIDLPNWKGKNVLLMKGETKQH